MFNVGDIVTGIPGVHVYAITTERAIMEVVATSGNMMNVRVISHEIPALMTDSINTVEQRYFVHATPQSEREDLSVWVDKKGSGTPFKEMTMAHLTNVIAMLNREEGKKNAQRSKLVTLEKELLRRLKEQYEVQEGR